MRNRLPTALFLTASLLSALYASPQETLNRLDAAGRKQGPWKKTDTAGHVVYTGRFRDNIPVDTFRYYYSEGNLKTVSVFSEHGSKVRSESYFKNGKPMAKGIYLNEKKDSVWQFFSDYDGALLSEENYRNGLKDGTAKIFFQQGGVSETITWKNDVRDGLWETFYSDGKIKMKGGYANGDKSGPFIFYYNSGTTMITGDYLEGHQHGNWVYYSDKGEVVRTEKYDRGILLDKTPKDN
jgi:antitoxin component YwqK of YwqJK toxin-antitoxin module